MTDFAASDAGTRHRQHFSRRLAAEAGLDRTEARRAGNTVLADYFTELRRYHRIAASGADWTQADHERFKAAADRAFPTPSATPDASPLSSAVACSGSFNNRVIARAGAGDGAWEPSA